MSSDSSPTYRKGFSRKKFIIDSTAVELPARETTAGTSATKIKGKEF